MNRILIDYGRYDTILWLSDGFTMLKGNLMEVAEKIYNITTTKYVNEENPDKYYIKQEYELLIDYFGGGQKLEDVLIEKYNLKIERCNVYKNHQHYNCDKQSTIKLHEDAFKFNVSHGDKNWFRNMIGKVE
jgi:hypothetical protein